MSAESDLARAFNKTRVPLKWFTTTILMLLSVLGTAFMFGSYLEGYKARLEAAEESISAAALTNRQLYQKLELIDSRLSNIEGQLHQMNRRMVHAE
jgi:hypothetical protein